MEESSITFSPLYLLVHWSIAIVQFSLPWRSEAKQATLLRLSASTTDGGRFMYVSLGVAYAGLYGVVLMLSLSVAAGFHYLLELSEEHSSLVRRVCDWAAIGVLALHLPVWLVDGAPWECVLVGALAHCAYKSLLPSFPFVALGGTRFLLSASLFVLSNVLWVRYLIGEEELTVAFILGFLFPVAWLVPLGIFVGVAANESWLPGSSKGRAMPSRS